MQDYLTILRTRGHVLAENDTLGSDHKGRDYDDAKGPSGRSSGGRKLAARDYRMPFDLLRSRRVGLIARVCSRCGAFKDNGRCDHYTGCDAGPYDEARITTGPMGPDQTSADTGWRLVN